MDVFKVKEGGTLVTHHSEIWGETEKPARMMDTRVIGDDPQGVPNTC